MVTKIGRRVREYEGKPIIYGYPYEDLVAWFEEHGEKKFRQWMSCTKVDADFCR